jgi:endogenous inhibitor of DNA gyrase (YacG/DUF329 family)
MPNDDKPSAPAGKCPICGKPTVRDYRPFCSRRCADVDLSRWLSGAYAVPVEDVADKDTAADGQDNPPRQEAQEEE